MKTTGLTGGCVFLQNATDVEKYWLYRQRGPEKCVGRGLALAVAENEEVKADGR